MVAVELLFWTLLLLVLYVYAGYPLLLGLIAARRCRIESWELSTTEITPTVTLLISAYNESNCISEKLENSLALEFPRECLDVIVVSDASEDATDELVNRFAPQGIRLIRMARRGGKTVGLNAGVLQSSADIVVFSDANALYRPDAIRHLIAPFVDSEVGAVIGESTYNPSQSESGRSESLYWRYETWIKKLESQGGSVVGGDGAIYAVRRSLYKPMAADALSDFVNPLQVVKDGFRCVYEPRALSYEDAAADFGREYRRKVRIVNRAWRALWSMREMLNPFRYREFALKLWSHKVLRWLVPLAGIAIVCGNILLLQRDAIYEIIFILQLAFYALAILGFFIRHGVRQPSLFRVPFYFCLVNIAAGVGLLQALGGKSYTTWTTSREGG